LFGAADHHREVFSFWPLTKGDIRKAVEVIAGTVKRRKIIHALTIGPPEIVTDIAENEVKQFSHLPLTFPGVLQELDAKKKKAKLSTIYKRIKKHEKMQSPLV
jgi:hypothetical protein